VTYRSSRPGLRESRRRGSGARQSFLALFGVVGAVAFIVLASSLGPDLPAATAGPATLPIGLGSRPPGATEGADAGSPVASAGVLDTREALVPVVGFRSTTEATDAAEVAAINAGTSPRYTSIELPADVEGPAAAVLGLPSPAVHVRIAADAAALRRDLAAHADRLGFLPASAVDPSVRGLAWGNLALFGVHRLATLDGWPLLLPAPAGEIPAGAGYDPATAWTLVAAGDINLDGQVAYHVKQLRLGVDFPFDGGTATITGHTCCSSAGLPLPTARRTGHDGAVRDLLSLADLSIADFENPAPDNFAYHPAGNTFSADPALVVGLANAGIDWVSLANNHIGDYGDQGILDTLQNLDTYGIAHGGAEANLAAARDASLLQARGVTVGILAYDTIKPADAATADGPGSNEMSVARVRADVGAARAAGAQLVIVFAHWGADYTATTTAAQRTLAHAAIDAGADLVIGSHTHWAGGIELYKGRPIFYSLGDFIFGLARSEQTEEGPLLELTFEGTRLVQVRIRPYLILDLAQPNLLDPAGSGATVLRQMFGASPGLPW